MITERQRRYIEAGLFEKCIKDVANELNVSTNSVSSMRRRLRYRKPPETSPEYLLGPSRWFHERVTRDRWIEHGLFTRSIPELKKLTGLSKDVILAARNKYRDDPKFPHPVGYPNARVNRISKEKLLEAIQKSTCFKDAQKKLKVSYRTFKILIDFHGLQEEAQRIHGRSNRAWRKYAEDFIY
jgi:hypothetical protein